MTIKAFATGNTWPERERLKGLGGEWNAREKRWEFPRWNEYNEKYKNSIPGVMFVMVDDFDWDLPSEIERPSRPERTLTYGDERRWFNYFAEQNPIAFFGFSSLGALCDFVEATPVQDGMRGRGWDRGDKWFGTPNMPAALKLARNGWPDGIELAEQVRTQLTGRNALQRRRSYGVAGGIVNIGRLLSGNPAHMTTRPKQPGRKVITFFVQSVMSASIKTEHAIIRAAMTGAIADVLEMNGYSCEIVSIGTVREFDRTPAFQIATTLKNAGEPLNLNDVIFALGHPSFLRRLQFACAGSCDALQDVCKNAFGIPSLAFTDDHPLQPNEFFVDFIAHDLQGLISDKAPLLDKALQIWDLVTDGKLPIEIKRGER